MGVRRGRPVLSTLPAGALLGLVLVASACQSLSLEEEARLAVYRENSQQYYDRGDYARALHQAESALELDPEIMSVQLVRGFCLLKLGKQAGNSVVIDRALEQFESIARSDEGRDDFRVHLGLGAAHLARALVYADSISRIESRLESQFLAADGRAAEQAKLAAARDQRTEHLMEAEAALRRVLAFDLQKNNIFALVDLVLVLHSQGHEAEAKATAEQALALLDESNLVTSNSLKRNSALSPMQRLDLESRIESNREKERQMRDLLGTIDLKLGDTRGYLEQMRILESRGLLGEVQYYNRAGVHEELGLLAEAAEDLEQFLRLRSRRFDYEQDDMAPGTFARIEALRARIGTQAGR